MKAISKVFLVEPSIFVAFSSGECGGNEDNGILHLGVPSLENPYK